MAEQQSIFQQLLTQKPLPNDLVIVYSDLHGFHGGITYELGAGKITYRYQHKTGWAITPVTKNLSEEQLASIVALLIELEAWNQQEAKRYAIPDESFANLSIKVADHEAHTWEAYNDLHKNNRLILIINKIQEVFSAYAS